MSLRIRVIIACAVLVIVVSLASTAVVAIDPTVSDGVGHWEIVRQIAFDTIPAENLDGDVPLPYRVYLVSFTGFHTEQFGMTVGPDDDVRYTLDGGESWTRATGDLYCRHGLDIVDERVAWHCGNGGTRVSMDGGQTWNTVAPSVCPSMSFLDARTGWAASPLALQVTTDGGTSWQTLTVPLGDQQIVAVALRTAADGYVLSTSGDLFVTADGGESWDVRSLGLQPGVSLMATLGSPYAALRFLDADHGMVAYSLSDQSVWFAITQDGGLNWQHAEISDLRGQSYYYRLYLSRDTHLLTVTDDFNRGANVSLVLRYQE